MTQTIPHEDNKRKYTSADYAESVRSRGGSIRRSWRIPHSFDHEIAADLGIEAAVVEYCTRESEKSCMVIEDILIYCYYFTEEQVKRAIAVLHEAGIVEDSDA